MDKGVILQGWRHKSEYSVGIGARRAARCAAGAARLAGVAGEGMAPVASLGGGMSFALIRA
jgi:hypothetical protein